MSSVPRWKYGKPVPTAVTPASVRKARAYMCREPTPGRRPRYDRGVIWEPFVLALVLGLIISAGLYFAYLWPSVEPIDPADPADADEDAPAGSTAPAPPAEPAAAAAHDPASRAR